jgi:IS30 family transposase
VRRNIYRGLFAGVLGTRTATLRTGRARRKPQRRGVAAPNKIKNMRLLNRRPAEATARCVAGHWEGDLIIGARMNSAIGTLVNRVTRFVVLIHLPHGYKAAQLRDALIEQTTTTRRPSATRSCEALTSWPTGARAGVTLMPRRPVRSNVIDAEYDI